MDFSKLKKLESPGARRAGAPDNGLVTAIVKVKQANYHPDLLVVRSQIGSFLFTAEFKARDLDSLESDPLVESISLAQPLFLHS